MKAACFCGMRCELEKLAISAASPMVQRALENEQDPQRLVKFVTRTRGIQERYGTGPSPKMQGLRQAGMQRYGNLTAPNNASIAGTWAAHVRANRPTVAEGPPKLIPMNNPSGVPTRAERLPSGVLPSSDAISLPPSGVRRSLAPPTPPATAPPATAPASPMAHRQAAMTSPLAARQTSLMRTMPQMPVARQAATVSGGAARTGLRLGGLGKAGLVGAGIVGAGALGASLLGRHSQAA